MTKKEMRELDAWIAEYVFGIEVERDADGEPYNAAGVFCGTIISYIRCYTKNALAFSAVKREIERRGWDWECMYFGQAKPPFYRFTIHTVSFWDAETEEIAGCLAIKEAIEKTRTGIREDAIAAYEKEKVKQQARKIKRDAKLAALTAKLVWCRLGIEPDKTSPFGAEIEGLFLRRTAVASNFGIHQRLQLWGECPICHQECFSRPLNKLADLGQMLEKFEPEHKHSCEGSRSYRVELANVRL